MTKESNNKRIAKNTLFLYVRMFLTMGVSLYTSRVILNVLGVEDYGIYSVVGGVVTMFVFFNSAMTLATERFLAIDIGKGDWDKLGKTFNSVLVIHVVIALLVLLIAETVGLWFVNNKLNLPPERIDVVLFVYHFSIVSSMITITQSPFNALIIVRERMNIFAIIGIVEAVLKLLIVYLLFISPFDKLKSYSILLLLVTIMTTTIYKVYCLRNFKESKFVPYYDKTLYKELISYSGWSLIGNIAAVGKGQGINVLLNVFFGTAINATYGIMIQVHVAVDSFVRNFQTAINPQIYKDYSQERLVEMQELMFQGSRFSFFLLLVLVSPIIYNIDYVLILWLENPPPFTETFVVLTLVNLMVECISYPLITGAMATGKIKNYQIVVGSILFLNLPISYFVYQYFDNPSLFLYVAICLSIVALFFRLFFLKAIVNLNVQLFFKQVLRPIILLSFSIVLSIYLLKEFTGGSKSIVNFIFSSFTIVLVNCCLIYIVGLSKKEREFVISYIKEKLKNK